jgi:germination protein M
MRPGILLRIATIALLVAACGPSISTPSVGPTPGPTASPGASIGASAVPTTTESTTTDTTTVRAYFVLGSFVDNAGLVPVEREIPQTQAVGAAVAAAAIEALLAGPNDTELGASPAMYTNIPEGTRFLGLTIANGLATVNLSSEFGADGGSASVRGRLAQVVYTLTQFPTVTGVLFQVDGVPKTVFGADGLTFDGPLGRADFTDQLPAIFVDQPAWGGVLGSPARLVGLANVFEASFQVEILGASDRLFASGPVTATCGTGCWGSFDVTIPYVGAGDRATLRVFEPSAKDGSRTNTTEYPVRLTP